jgi:uncharacterized RDD family membrane protein YckC
MTENTADDRSAGRRPARREPPLAAAARQLAAQKAAGVPEASTPPPPPPGQTYVSPGAPPPAPAPQYAYYPPPAAPATAGSPSEVLMDPVYSPWWKRVCASLIDGVTVSIPNGIIISLLGRDAFQTDPATGLATFHLTAGYLTALIICGVGVLVYYVVMDGGPTAATVGKMAMHITVRDESTWAPIGYGRALGRRLLGMVLWWLLFLPGLLDVLWPLWDGRRQTWHDKAVHSVVVDKA